MKAIVYSLIVIVFNSCDAGNKNLRCEDFKIGIFLLHSEHDGSTTTIERNDSMQFETSGNGIGTTAKVKWINNCEYELLYLMQDAKNQDSIHPYISSHPLRIKIVQTSNNYYVFEARVKGVESILKDTLFKDVE